VTTFSPALFQTLPAIDASGRLSFTPSLNASGASTIMVTRTDNGGTASGGIDTYSEFFFILISPINDAPSISILGNQTAAVSSGAKTVNNFAIGFTPGGGTDEASQFISDFVVSNDNPSLFLSQPTIDTSGTLRYTPSATVGTASVSVRVRDSGGIQSGGVDLSTARTFTITLQAAAASIVNRRVFYNNAGSVFGTNGVNSTDINLNPVLAIDTTKTALLPGATASVANYTNYSRGINGIVIDISNATNLAAINASSFQFATWSSFPDATPNFVTITPTVTVSTFATGGQGGSGRIKLTFADGSIVNSWLRVTLLASPLSTGLSANDVFYFGNARFDVNPTNPTFSTQVTINVLDANQIRGQSGLNSNVVSNPFDVDRSGSVNVLDANATRGGNGINSLRFFTAPASLQLASSAIAPPVLSPKIIKRSLAEATDDFFSEFVE
jgi:hypothetical protein